MNEEKDIGKEIYELACILYKNIEYNLGWHDCIYLADQAVKRGYRKQVEGEWVTDIEYYSDDYSECNTRQVFACSRCGRFEKYPQPYCNCGAHMRNGE